MVGHRTDVSSKSNVVSFPVPGPQHRPDHLLRTSIVCSSMALFSSHPTPRIGDASPPQGVLSHSLPAQSPRSQRRRPFEVDPIIAGTGDTTLFLGIHHLTPLCLTKWPGH